MFDQTSLRFDDLRANQFPVSCGCKRIALTNGPDSCICIVNPRCIGWYAHQGLAGFQGCFGMRKTNGRVQD